jgi:AcrR family transcriptional regulator
MFWANNYVGVDVDQIARAVNVTKPALYREFGDKATLLLKAVERYANNYGAPMMEAFLAEPDIGEAVANFCEATINTATTEPRLGCMMASAALGQSERVAEIRSFFAQGLSAAAHIFAEKFEKEIDVPPSSVALGFGVFRHCNGLDGQLLCVLSWRQTAQ